jgi:membrane protein YdbS with pleckstrin-like domain
VLPFLRWRTRTYTLTTRRLVTRSGILSKRSHDLPLSRVNDVSSERGLTDRVLGCGTLVVQTAAEGGSIVLVDVPDVEHVHATVTELLLDAGEPSWPAARPAAGLPFPEPAEERLSRRSGSRRWPGGRRG